MMKRAVVIGGGHGLGFGFVEALRQRHPEAEVLATYRRAEKAADLLSLAKQDNRVRAVELDAGAADVGDRLRAHLTSWQGQNFDLACAINTVGFLHRDATQPEKRLAQCTQEQLLESFRINAIVTPLIAAALQPFFRHSEPSVFATVSAKVGSIEDNGLGGWYGYRASKAALNMFLRNIALEYRRTNCATLVLGLHPGTVATELSEPFRGGIKHEVFSVAKSVALMMDVLESENDEYHGRLVSHDGSVIPF